VCTAACAAEDLQIQQYITEGSERLACLLEERLSTVEEKSLDIGVGWLLEPSVE
jgi:hypothetical protein